ncbi:MAG: soul heme-binding protein [Flavobacteriales bacterium]|nr:soul heme-binding protein [Flavobacteriales bacterium]|tara:strand:- start:5917 stop:6459 length:543 start_codon:yes stop_codon:yes gene_type:complete
MKKLFLLLFPFLNFGQDASTYEVIKVIEKIEIRAYNPALFASYINDEQSDTQDSSFRVLANYIFGSNERTEEIAMTSPVVIRLFNNDEMLFRMPEKYNKENLPKPNNEKVKFVETNYVQKAVIKYSGYSNTERENQKIEELKIILKKYNITHNNKFELFVYDPPYKFFNRRNEISVNVLK